METSDWKVLTCPKCTCLVKTARNLKAVRVTCPSCHHSFEVAPSVGDAAEPSQIKLPDTRNFNPNPNKVRGEAKEAWEVKAPDLRQIDFKEKLGKTTDHTKTVDPNAPPRRRRKVVRSNVQSYDNLLSWDEKRITNASLGKRLKQFLSRVPWALVIVVLGLLGGIAYKIHKMRNDQYASNYEAPQPIKPIELTADDKFELTSRATILDDISPTLVKFLDCKNPEEMKPLVREPERVIPLMDQFYKAQTPFAPATYHGLPKVENLRVEKRFIVASMEDAQFENFIVTLEKTPKGYLVDWESFVGYGDMSITKLRESRPKDPVTMRCIVSLDNYYNYDFSDKTLHQSYKLRTKDDEVMIYGYVPRLSPIHEKIMSSQLNQEILYCVLKLKYPATSSNDKQVEITEFLQSGWVFREIPEPKHK